MYVIIAIGVQNLNKAVNISRSINTLWISTNSPIQLPTMGI